MPQSQSLVEGVETYGSAGTTVPLRALASDSAETLLVFVSAVRNDGKASTWEVRASAKRIGSGDAELVGGPNGGREFDSGAGSWQFDLAAAGSTVVATVRASGTGTTAWTLQANSVSVAKPT